MDFPHVTLVNKDPYVRLEKIEGLNGEMLNYFSLSVEQAEKLRDDLDAALKDA